MMLGKPLELLSFDHILNVVVVQILENWNFPLLYWNVKELSSPFRESTLFENFETEVLLCCFYRDTLDLVANPLLGNLSPPQNALIPQICLLLIAARLNAETGTLSSCLHRVDTETWKKFWRSRSGYPFSHNHGSGKISLKETNLGGDPFSKSMILEEECWSFDQREAREGNIWRDDRFGKRWPFLGKK